MSSNPCAATVLDIHWTSCMHHQSSCHLEDTWLGSVALLAAPSWIVRPWQAWLACYELLCGVSCLKPPTFRYTWQQLMEIFELWLQNEYNIQTCHGAAVVSVVQNVTGAATMTSISCAFQLGCERRLVRKRWLLVQDSSGSRAVRTAATTAQARLRHCVPPRAVPHSTEATGKERSGGDGRAWHSYP
eukprot:1138065-Pelagomonas_calceolata.AAC.6